MKNYLITLLCMFGLSIAPVFSQNEEREEEIRVQFELFRTQFKEIVEDFPNNFKNIKEEKNLGNDKYNSKIQLNFAEESYLSQRDFSDELAFIATFGDYENMDDAVKVFENVIYLIEGIDFSFSLVSDQTESETESMYYWLVFDLESDLYSKMVIKVRGFARQNFSLDENAQDNTYSVVVNIEKI